MAYESEGRRSAESTEVAEVLLTPLTTGGEEMRIRTSGLYFWKGLFPWQYFYKAI